MSEGEAARAAGEQGSRNLLMQVLAAAVLAPAAIAIAYAGGWPWATLVTLTAIGLYVEWLMIVGASRETSVLASGGVSLGIAGLCLAAGRMDLSVAALVSESVPLLCLGGNGVIGLRRGSHMLRLLKSHQYWCARNRPKDITH